MELRRLEESFRYTKSSHQISGNVTSALRQGPEALEAARLAALRGKPERLAELMYGGRMGNDSPGDGFKYRGRGYIQLTGKESYLEASKALGLDLVNKPDLAADPDNASRIAVWYWKTNVQPIAPENVARATRIINGGYNGLEDRKSRFAEWDRKLTPEVVAQLRTDETRFSTEELRDINNGEKSLLERKAAASAWENKLSQGYQPGTLASAPSVDRQPANRQAPESSSQNAPSLLQQGDRGTSVTELQRQLNALGYSDGYDRPLAVDGRFGPATRHAVEAFQRNQGLASDGIAGPKTLATIRDPAYGKQPSGPVPQINEAGHPGFHMFCQAQAGVHQLDARHGRVPDLHSDQLSACLAVTASFGEWMPEATASCKRRLSRSEFIAPLHSFLRF